MSGLLLRQAGLSALQLTAQGSGFLLGGGKRLLLTLEFGPMAFSLPGEDRLRFFLKSRSQACDQVLQGLTHGHRTCRTATLLLFQFTQVAMDRGLGARVAQSHPNRVHGRLLALGQQRVTRFLDIPLIKSCARHGTAL
ncbi:hypothetical protein XEUV315_22675 [Xanthomonas euvesicatoria]|nr:hypothetical protein XEUV315_22675 [Xanthomonas euvesicatoria]